MFDTHCHLNFSRFSKNVDDVIARAQSVGVTHILIPGTDVTSSRRAIEIATEYESMYVAVGIHPHHVFEYVQNGDSTGIQEIEALLGNSKVVAVGEVGMDRHEYAATKYDGYSVTEDFLKLQSELLKSHIELAIQHKKSLVLHNREAKDDLLKLLNELWDSKLAGRTVLHCCEPDKELLQFAVEKNIYIGVDGDITYYPEKQEFIKTVPLDRLVLETDAPFLLPEPLRTEKKFPNEPANLLLIAEFIAKTIGVTVDALKEQTLSNSLKLFQLPENK